MSSMWKHLSQRDQIVEVAGKVARVGTHDFMFSTVHFFLHLHFDVHQVIGFQQADVHFNSGYPSATQPALGPIATSRHYELPMKYHQ